MFRRIIAVCTAFLLSSTMVFAHSGRTDAYGGHYDLDIGEYHYHHGFPAHQHINGVCPYDFKDSTNHNNSNSNSINSIVPNTVGKKAYKNPIAMCICLAILTIFLIIYILKRSMPYSNVKIQFYDNADNSFNITEIERAVEASRVAKLSKISTSPLEKHSFVHEFVDPRLIYKRRGDFEIDNDGRLYYKRMSVDIYIASSGKGKCYHFKQGCSQAFRTVNITDFLLSDNYNALSPCLKCASAHPYLPIWFYHYLEYYKPDKHQINSLLRC